jgi:hypothetical protein
MRFPTDKTLRAPAEACMTHSQSRIPWPAEKTRLNVKEAAELLESVCPLAPLAKDNDSDLRRDLIQAERVVSLRQKIRRAAQECRIQLIHLTLGLAVAGPDDLDEDLLIERQEFEKLAKVIGLDILEADIGASSEIVAAMPVGTEAQTTGTRTNKAAAAERACEEYLRRLQLRPKNKDTAFAAAFIAVADHGPLSRKAFEHAWKNGAPTEWKVGGARKGARKLSTR